MLDDCLTYVRVLFFKFKTSVPQISQAPQRKDVTLRQAFCKMHHRGIFNAADGRQHIYLSSLAAIFNNDQSPLYEELPPEAWCPTAEYIEKQFSSNITDFWPSSTFAKEKCSRIYCSTL